MIGALLASSFADLVGRRAAQLLNNAFFIGGSLAMAIAPSYWWLVCARTAVGLGVGVSSALTNLYISEISPAAYRGQLGGWAPFSVTAGILSSYILSCVLGEYVPAYLAWRLILGIGTVPAVVMLFVGAFEHCLPESPRWLLTKGRPVRAFRSSMLLHGTDQKENIQRDLDGILLKMTLRKAGGGRLDLLESHGSSYNSDRRLQSSNITATGSGFATASAVAAVPAVSAAPAPALSSSNTSAPTNEATRDARTPSERLESELVAGLGGDDVSGCDCCCRLCSRRKYRGAMLAGIGINVLQQVSGINVVIYFGPQILKEAGFGSVQATALTAGVSTAQLISVVVLMRLVDRVGRRPMAFIGLAFMIVGLSTIGVAFLILCEDGSSSVIGAWAAVAGMLIYRIAFSLSLGPLPYIVTAEVFPNEVRACGVTVAWAANWVANFGVTLSFPLVKQVFADLTGGNEALGSACLFGVYVVFSALAVCFVAKYVPETARRELDEL
jgi:MFS family permease